MKALKRIGIIIGVFFLLLIGLISIALNFFQDEIGQKVVSEVNALLTTELEVGSFGVSLIRTFPNLGVNLKDIQLADTRDGRLLEAEELSFRASLFSLLGSNLQLKSVVLRDAALHIHYDRQGKSNFDIFKTTESVTESEGSAANIQLGEASVNRLELIYEDEQNQQALALSVDDATFAGDFGSERYRLDSDILLYISMLEDGGERLLAGQRLELSAKVDVDQSIGRYQFDQVAVQLGQLPLSTSGVVISQESDTEIDLNFTSDGATLADLIDLLPPSMREQLSGIETRGDFSLNGTVKGKYNNTNQPAINIDLSMANGQLRGERIVAKVRDIGFRANFNNGSNHSNRTAKLSVENFAGEMDGEPFAMDLTIENLDDPTIDFSANGALAPGLLLGFIPDERITDAQGLVRIRELGLNGRYEDMLRASRLHRVKLNGQLNFEGAGFTINDERISLEEGSVMMRGNELKIDQVVLQAPDTEIRFNGQATNVLPVLFADSLNSQSAQLGFTADLRANSLDIDQLLALGAPSEEVQEEAEATGQADSLAQAEVEKRAFFTSFLNGTFSATIDEFNYGEISGENFQGDLIFTPGELQIKGKTEAMDGSFQLDGDLLFANRPKLSAKLTANNISAYEFFRQAENFGQEVLVADNLEGDLDARIFIEAEFDEEGTFQEDKLHVLGGLGINDGVLKDFAMLEDFSAFVDIRDLREIRFRNLENFFEVRNRKLHLPVMFIQSNALNLTISGEHTFDQDIAYYLKVNAGQIMADRFRQHDANLKPKPARRNGFFNLYYAILGDLDNYNFNSDKRRVKRDFEESERRRRDIHYALEQAFGTVIELVDEPLDWRDIPEYEEDPDSDEPEFLDMEIEGGR